MQPPGLSFGLHARNQADELRKCIDEMPRRLRLVLQNNSAEELARDTGISGESVRRYLAGHTPSCRFLAALCLNRHICGTWLLTGVGSPQKADSIRKVLSDTTTDELLAEMGRRFDRVFSLPSSLG